MERPDQEKSKVNTAAFQDDFLEGTSARTRPFSFEDIMHARKSKGDNSIKTENEPGVASIPQSQDETMLNSLERYIPVNEDSVAMNIKLAGNDTWKESARKKRYRSTSRKSDKYYQDEKLESRGPEFQLKSVVERNFNSRSEPEIKVRRLRSSFHEKGTFRNDDSVNESDEKHFNHVFSKGRIHERIRERSRLGRRELPNVAKEVLRKSKTAEQKVFDSENENRSQSRSAKDVIHTAKLTDRGRDNSDKERKPKHRNDMGINRGGTAGKKYYSEKKLADKNSEHHEESRSKRRTLSREHVNERARSLVLHTTKLHKRRAKDKGEHEDRSGREHSVAAEKKRISSNGAGNHYRHNSGSSSGLGGYSPRKRKTDAAAKTPSPIHRSPERRTAGWDLQPAEMEKTNAGLTIPNTETETQNLFLSLKDMPSVTPVIQVALKPIPHVFPLQMHTFESVQLTEATRPMRRLYADNLPASASDKDLIEIINRFFLSSGAIYIQGTQPCISCIIHKDKGQALLEFLTPEDASAALTFKGLSYLGSSLNLRRPKDYVITTTGFPEKFPVAVDSVCSTVEDSPHKIFLGGVPNHISSKMLLEIVKAFGAVKAFHFVSNDEISEPYAFFEYVDHSVTCKACAGLNGLRLGGKVLTAVFANPDAVLGNTGNQPFYGVPEHARSLLENPTSVLKLKNALNPAQVRSMTDSELEEILEDIRLECSRFGLVKSINITKPMNRSGTTESNGFKDAEYNETGEAGRSESSEANCELRGEAGDLNDINERVDEVVPNAKKDDNNHDSVGEVEMENKAVSEYDELNLEMGDVLIEYKRSESACMAAHGLQGRAFDGRVVSVGYANEDFYHHRFGR